MLARVQLSLVILFAVAVATISFAQPTTQASGGATGTWKWQQPGFNGDQDVTRNDPGLAA